MEPLLKTLQGIAIYLFIYLFLNQVYLFIYRPVKKIRELDKFYKIHQESQNNMRLKSEFESERRMRKCIISIIKIESQTIWLLHQCKHLCCNREILCPSMSTNTQAHKNGEAKLSLQHLNYVTSEKVQCTSTHWQGTMSQKLVAGNKSDIFYSRC